ncbi:MAG: hypothetical protein HYU64_21565 [Armatimonadetes bacterium]|nr:hypothetical protein [Armatimonadota bacterium]
MDPIGFPFGAGSGLSKSGVRSISTPEGNAPPETTKDTVSRSLREGVGYLTRIQKIGGHWAGKEYLGTSQTAFLILANSYLGIPGKEKENLDAANWLLGKQQPDGSFRDATGRESGALDLTCMAYLALKQAGVDPERVEMKRIRQYVESKGGIEQTNIMTKLILSKFGEYDALRIHMLPPAEIFLLPGTDRLFAKYLSSWTRTAVVPVIAMKEAAVREQADRNRVSEAIHNVWDKVAGRPAEERLKRWLLARQGKGGDWNGSFTITALSLMALKDLGLSTKDTVMQKGIAFLDTLKERGADTVEAKEFESEIWDTSLSVRALLRAGVPASDYRVQKARKFLESNQEREAIGDWTLGAPEAVPGGWPFQVGNSLYPDTDDTAEVVLALEEAGGDRKTTHALHRGIQWLLGMQNNDGGWGAFDRNNGSSLVSWASRKVHNLAGHGPFDTSYLLYDRSSPDVTAHVLEALGKSGFTLKDPPVAKTIEYLKRDQAAFGGWWGRWGVNYVYGTGSVLAALAQVGENMESGYIQKAVQWLESRQNPDGGWGEVMESYSDPSKAGVGPSTPSLTAISVLGLLEAGEVDSPAVKRGIEYLQKTQGKDGSWKDTSVIGVAVGPSLLKAFPSIYIDYGLVPNYVSLLALGAYHRLTRAIDEEKLQIVA